MAKASDYQVGFGYGAQDGYYYGPNGIVGPYHRGNDFYTPTGTDLVINGQVIGETGATGTVSGPHVHVQLSPEANPSGKEWNFPGAVVTETGFTRQEGNYIKVRGNDGYVRMYFHLSEIFVKKGDNVGVTMEKVKAQDVRNLYPAVFNGQPANDGDIKAWEGTDFKTFMYGLISSGMYQSFIIDLANWKSEGLRLSNEVEELKKQQAVMQDQIKQLNETILSDRLTIKDLTAQLAVQSEDTKLLNGFGEWLQKIIVRLGVKK